MKLERSSTEKNRILVVDDENAIQKFLLAVLESADFTVQVADNGAAALAAAAMFRPDVMLLDLGLPDIDGVKLIQRLREWSTVPIIVLSVRDHEDDKALALDAGADDYLNKPFSTVELLARIRAALRRVVQTPEPIFRSGGLLVDFASRAVTLNEAEVGLTPTEYEILRLLVSHAGKVVTHTMILKHVWGEAHVNQSQLLRVNISKLRHKIESDASRPKCIITEPGVGYKFRVTG